MTEIARVPSHMTFRLRFQVHAQSAAIILVYHRRLRLAADLNRTTICRILKSPVYSGV